MEPAELTRLARKGKFDELQSAWMDAVAEPDLDVERLVQVAGQVAERGREELAETLVWFLVDALRERGEHGRALRAGDSGARLLPESSLLRQLVCDLWAEEHAGQAGIEELIALTVADRSLPLDQAVEAMEKMMSLRPGDYVVDSRRGTVGRVQTLDLERRGLVIATDDGQKVYGPGLVGRLEPTEEDDFRALCAFERERLERLAGEDPEELVRLALTTLDKRMEQRRLRLYLEPVVGSWSKWWSAARGALRRSSVIGMTEGRSPSLFLRSKPLSHGQRLQRKFDAAESPLERLAQALHIAREAEQHGRIEPEVLAGVAERLAEVARRRAAGRPALAVGAAAVLDALARQGEAAQVFETLPEGAVRAAMVAPEAVAACLTDPEVLLCAVAYLRRREPDLWPQFAAALMPLAPREACAGVAGQLRAAGAGAARAEGEREILGRPDAHPGALAWLWRECASAAGGPEAELAPVAVAIEALNALAGLVRAADLSEDARRERIAELRNALFVRDGRPLRDALERARPEQVAAVKSLGERNPALTPAMQEHLSRMLQAIRPVLFEKEVPPWEEELTYSTQAGIERRKRELEQIVHERLPQVIREIGQAAGFGDISDNAEYQSAVQERGRLAERATRLQEEIAEARLITPEMAAEAEHVTIGSRVTARNLATDELETFTFLGPWEASPEQRIYAYNAPLGREFMGREVGETVTVRIGLDERAWQVVSVEPGL